MKVKRSSVSFACFFFALQFRVLSPNLMHGRQMYTQEGAAFIHSRDTNDGFARRVLTKHTHAHTHI